MTTPSDFGLTRVFFDDFTTLDPASWVASAGKGYGIETFAISQVAVQSSEAELTAVPEGPLSGEISTEGKHSWLFGWFECVALLPNSQAMWPAFWTLDDHHLIGARSEIDIAEMRPSHHPGSYVHWGVAGDSGSNGSMDYLLDMAVPHRYVAHWQPTRVDFYVDGVRLWAHDGMMPDASPHHLRLDLAIGGTWQGAPDATTVWPSVFRISEVSVWQLVAHGKGHKPHGKA